MNGPSAPGSAMDAGAAAGEAAGSSAEPASRVPGGGQMGARMRSMDWSATPLGPAESWPPALRTAIRARSPTRCWCWARAPGSPWTTARDFFQLFARQIAADAVRVVALALEQERAAQLAALDRDKTAFFSNVSHEFRTPLTLILGPTEEALASPGGALAGEQLERVHGNAQRLLKLVNTLLEFSRVEAGRARAAFRPTHLAALTAEIASAFEPVIHAAGLGFVVDCPPLPEPLWVDPSLWEKVVLNLVSNAFKFTLTGQVAVRLRWTGEGAELAVEDTGIGLAPDQLPRVFQRFHRVEGSQGRSHEGSGIGLSLVKELVKLHGGEVSVKSALGAGSTFTVTLRAGSAHLPAQDLPAEARQVESVAGGREALTSARRHPHRGGAVHRERRHDLPGEAAPRGGAVAPHPALAL